MTDYGMMEGIQLQTLQPGDTFMMRGHLRSESVFERICRIVRGCDPRPAVYRVLRVLQGCGCVEYEEVRNRRSFFGKVAGLVASPVVAKAMPEKSKWIQEDFEQRPKHIPEIHNLLRKYTKDYSEMNVTIETPEQLAYFRAHPEVMGLVEVPKELRLGYTVIIASWGDEQMSQAVNQRILARGIK
jgi:hypothetical protein